MLYFLLFVIGGLFGYFFETLQHFAWESWSKSRRSLDSSERRKHFCSCRNREWLQNCWSTHRVCTWISQVGFYEVQRLEAEYSISVGQNEDYEFTKRTHPIIYTIIVNNLATLADIRDKYSIEEVLDLYEICLVNAYNKFKSSEVTEWFQKTIT